jgi:hypothetical protein
MKNYSKYEEGTGRIVGRLTCNESSAKANGPVVEGHWDPIVYRVVDGKVVKRDKDSAEELRIAKEQKGLAVRIKELLKDSDWTQMPDVPLSKEKKKEWKDYRQALRDLPHRTEDPRKLKMPRKPDD